MIEAEIKAKVFERIALKESLIKLGFVKEHTSEEYDCYYNGNDRDFKKTDEALRIRTCRNIEKGEEHNILTYKGKKLDNKSQARFEVETAVSDPSNMQAILTALGYLPVLEVKKCREAYRKDDITACVDHVDSLGDYIELELMIEDEKDYPKAVEQLYGWLGKLGIPRDFVTQYSYLELLLKQSQATF